MSWLSRILNNVGILDTKIEYVDRKVLVATAAIVDTLSLPEYLYKVDIKNDGYRQVEYVLFIAPTREPRPVKAPTKDLYDPFSTYYPLFVVTVENVVLGNAATMEDLLTCLLDAGYYTNESDVKDALNEAKVKEVDRLINSMK